MIFQVVTTLLMAASLKSMWNLLDVAQVIVYIRLITTWPPNGTAMLDLMEDGITMRKITKPVLEWGKSSFKDLN